jgi:hypothetical protein
MPAGTKLSEFPIAGSPPGPADTFVGVQSPATDVRYTPAQAAAAIGPLLPAGGAPNNIQFNNGGTFGGDANFSWYPSGTSPGGDHYGGVIDLLHGAIGSSGIIDTILLNAGEPSPPPNPPSTRPGSMVLNINENMFTSGSTADPSYGACVSIGYTNNSTGMPSLGSFYNWMTLNSNSTQDIGFCGANNNFLYNYYAGHIDSLDGLFFNVSNLRGNVDDVFAIVGFVENAFGTGFTVRGMSMRAFVDGTANIPDLYGIQVQVGTNNAATCTTQRGIQIQTPHLPTTTLTNNYGLEIQDQSGTGASSRNWNLYSEGNSSINVFDGVVITTPQLVATLPAAAAALDGARTFVTDATATTFASIVAGGGANHVPVYCDGSAPAWKIG